MYPYKDNHDCPYYYSERMNTGLLGCCVHGFKSSQFGKPEEKITELISNINELLTNTMRSKNYLGAHCYPDAARSVKGGGKYRDVYYPG